MNGKPLTTRKRQFVSKLHLKYLRTWLRSSASRYFRVQNRWRKDNLSFSKYWKRIPPFLMPKFADFLFYCCMPWLIYRIANQKCKYLVISIRAWRMIIWARCKSIQLCSNQKVFVYWLIIIWLPVLHHASISISLSLILAWVRRLFLLLLC